MKWLGLLLALTSVCAAEVKSRVWREGKLTLDVDGARETIEWISPAAIRVTRIAEGPPIKHDPVLVAFEQAALRMRSRVLSVEVGPDGGFRVRAGATDVVSMAATGTARLVNSPERVFDAGDLQYSDAGYGIYRRGPNDFVLYYGPSPKEILEQHQIVTGSQPAPREASPPHPTSIPARHITAKSRTNMSHSSFRRRRTKRTTGR